MPITLVNSLRPKTLRCLSATLKHSQPDQCPLSYWTCIVKIIDSLSFIFLLAAVSFCWGQTSGLNSTGIAKFQTRDVHQYDSINLADLSVYVNIPMRLKTGIIPFSMSLGQPLGATMVCCADSDEQAPLLPEVVGRTMYSAPQLATMLPADQISLSIV
jgi:hypothetical protein